MAESAGELVEYLLTTVDNPYDPFTQWDEWYREDERLGYYTPGLLARIVVTSDELPDPDHALAIQHAIDEIIRENISGMHIKVKVGDRPRATSPTAIPGQ